jgi:hypothetical protein
MVTNMIVSNGQTWEPMSSSSVIFYRQKIKLTVRASWPRPIVVARAAWLLERDEYRTGELAQVNGGC